MSKKNKIETASVLAFERKIDVSDAFFFQEKSGDDNSRKHINVREKSVRGTISNRLKNAVVKDPAKLDAAVENANLQTVDFASLDYDRNALIVSWTCKILPFEGVPNVCNNQDYQEKLQETIREYLAEHGVSELSRRYAINIINGRWLWRNRMGAKSIEILIKTEDEEIIFSNVEDYLLNDFEIEDEKVLKLARLIEKGFNGEDLVFFTVEARVIIGYGQEVYPSQELILDTGSNKKSKVLYSVEGQAGMHSQKIGNAIRCIDNWYSSDASFPIAIEPYGAVTTMGTAFRQPREKRDFYTLFDNWVLKEEKPEVTDQHYVMGVLIRGGVFGASGKE